jgi:hypothetical protein
MTLHHIGYVVNDIRKFESKMLFEKKINEVFDEKQQAILSLYKNYSNSYIELIEPLNEKAFTWNQLQKKGDHFHHLCYVINSREELDTIIEQEKMIEIVKSLPAKLFEMKEVSFYLSRNKQIVEFLIEN